MAVFLEVEHARATAKRAMRLSLGLRYALADLSEQLEAVARLQRADYDPRIIAYHARRCVVLESVVVAILQGRL